MSTTAHKEHLMDYRIEPELVHGQMTMFRVYAPDGTKQGCWFTQERAQQQIEELKNTAPKALPTTGWSNAAKRRAALKEADVDNALGLGVSSGKGYTMYEGADGSGRYNTQIWDES